MSHLYTSTTYNDMIEPYPNNLYATQNVVYMRRAAGPIDTTESIDPYIAKPDDSDDDDD